MSMRRRCSLSAFLGRLWAHRFFVHRFLPRELMRKLHLRRGIIECITTLSTAGGLVFGVTQVALADDDAVTRAAVLSREAEKLEADGKISEACEKYAQSQALDPRGGTLLDEAICREKEGKTGTAYNLFVQAEKVAQSEKQADRANTAKQHESGLFAKLARLTVNVPKEAMTDGLEIDAGVQVIPQSEWGKPYPVDAGTLKITATAPAK